MRRTLQIDAAQSVLIDALQGETFVIRMGTSIQRLQIKNVSPGQLYIFQLIQNQVGGHTIAWGAQISNGTAADPNPYSTTTQSFIGSTGGILRANLPGAVSD